MTAGGIRPGLHPYSYYGYNEPIYGYDAGFRPIRSWPVFKLSCEAARLLQLRRPTAKWVRSTRAAIARYQRDQSSPDHFRH